MPSKRKLRLIYNEVRAGRALKLLRASPSKKRHSKIKLAKKAMTNHYRNYITLTFNNEKSWLDDISVETKHRNLQQEERA